MIAKLSKLTNFLALSLIAVGLAACASRSATEMSYSEFQELAERLEASCLEQGVDPQSPEMDFCLRQELMAYEAGVEREARMRAAIASGMSAAGQSMQRSAAQRPVNCTTTPTYGGGYSTSCF